MESKMNIPEKMQQAGEKTQQVATSHWMTMLARLGYAIRGVVYLIIGLLAVQLAVGSGGTTTDQRGVLHIISDQPFGRFLLIVIAIGFIGYALWSAIQALFDADHKGTSLKGIVARLGYSVIGTSYALLAVGTIQLVLGAGQNVQSSTTSAQSWTARLLNYGPGVALVVVIGLIVLGVVCFLFYRAYSANFRRSLVLDELSEKSRGVVLFMGRLGYAAQGTVFCIVGLFLISAALRHNPGDAKGLDSALQVLLQQPFGPFLLALVALGLVAYGLYSFVEARYRRIAGRRFRLNE